MPGYYANHKGGPLFFVNILAYCQTVVDQYLPLPLIL